MRYDNEICNQFVDDMEAAGYDVEHYRGRSFWTGPAVRATERDREQDIIRATKVRLQSDSMGLGSIWYPVCSGRALSRGPRHEYPVEAYDRRALL